MVTFDRIQLRLFLIMGALILFLSGLFIYQEYKSRQTGLPDNPDLTDAISEATNAEDTNPVNSEKEETPAQVMVYVTGRVRRPGVITLREGDRVADAVELAGGCLPDADLSRINLAQKVKDEAMYYIPGIGEELPSHLETGASNHEESGKVNINEADQSLLETLTGIGPAKAKSIIEYREKHGSFKSIEEIMNVSGIGEKTFEKLKDHITVR